MPEISFDEMQRRRQANASVLGSQAMTGCPADAETVSLLERYALGLLLLEELSNELADHAMSLVAKSASEVEGDRHKIKIPCSGCGGTGKVVAPASYTRPHLYNAEQNGWYSLVLCIDCGTLWVEAPYEPYAAFVYLIAWPYSRASFNSAAALHGGLVMARWCDYKIREAWPTMSENDRLAVEHHRLRSLGRNPIDEVPSASDIDPLEEFLGTKDRAGLDK